MKSISGYRTIFAACLLTAILMMAGCSQKVVNNDKDLNVSVRLDYKILSPGEAQAIDHFILTVEGSDFGSMEIPMVAEGGFIVAEAVVPAGKARRFVARAHDKEGATLYQGQAVADVIAGQALTLDIDLFPVVPMVNLTPHYQDIVMNDSFYVDISVFNVPNITAITLDFVYNYAPVYLQNVEPGIDYGDTVGVYYYSSDAQYTYSIEVYHTNETGTIVDESGYANLARVWFGSYRDWATDTATVIMQVKASYIYSYSGGSVPVDSIYNDGARVQLYVPDSIVFSTWEKAIGGAGDDIGYATCKAHDGNLIIAGSTASFGAGYEDVYLAKVNLDGVVQWEKTFGGEGSDVGQGVTPTADGGYIISGSSESFPADEFQPDLYLIKTDANGNPAWEKTFGVGAIESGNSVMQTADGGFIVAGTAALPGGSSVYVIRTNPSGDSLWTGRFGSGDFVEGRSIAIAPEGNYVIAGAVGGFDYLQNVCLLFVDPQGRLIRQMSHGGTGDDAGYDITAALDGGYVVVGSSSSAGAGLHDVYIIKTNALGQFSWSKTYGFSGEDYGYAIEPTRDAGYIMAGATSSVGSQLHDVYSIKTGINGSAQWFTSYGGDGDDVGYAVTRTSDGGFLIAGYTDTFGAGGKDIYLLKTDAEGNIAPSAFSSFTSMTKTIENF